MEREYEFVEVTTRQLALDAPNFIVEYQGKLYITLAALEYDANARNLTREQKSGIKSVRKMFEAAEGGRAPAVVILDRHILVAQSSLPGFRKPTPPPPGPGVTGPGGG
jgi:hypothetical protein